MSDNTGTKYGGTGIGNLQKAVVDRLFPAASQKDRVALLAPSRAVNVLRLAANVADTETVTIGADVYEIETVATDTTRDTAAGELNNTTAVVVIAHTLAQLGAAVGDLLRVENEMMKILREVTGIGVAVIRGRCGTTIATHANGLDIFRGNGITAGRIPVGFNATFTPAVAGPAIAAEINNAIQGGERATAKASTIYNTFSAESLQSGAEVLVKALDEGALTTAVAETLAGANNVWSAAAFYGGSAAAVKRVSRMTRVPTATEVALGFMRFACDFNPSYAEVHVMVTATGVPVAWVGGRSISGNVVNVDNSGGTDWAATDTVTVIAYE